MAATLPATPDRRPQFAVMSAVTGLAAIAISGDATIVRAWLIRGFVAAVWLWAAYGYGRALRGTLFNRLAMDDPRRGPLQLALGVAFMLVFANLDLFGAGTTTHWVLGWAVLAFGWALTGWRWSRLSAWFKVDGAAGEPLLWCALPALAVLAAVAALPPGLAWSTEFGGYDALEYHLELPREWLAGGAMVPLRHNVYSAFPNFVEGAFLQLHRLSGLKDPAHLHAKEPQMLHALLAVAAAWCVGATAVETVRSSDGQSVAESSSAARIARAVAICAFLGIPWVIVTGSLAYDEMAVLLCLAGAMLAWTARDASGPARLGVALGLLLGAAVGAKLTSVGMVVLPFACWALLAPGTLPRPRQIGIAAAVAAAVALAALAPWLLRNHAATGSWTFPFVLPIVSGAEGAARNGWWTAEQVARFAAAHAAPAGEPLMDRLRTLWDAAFREGFGAAPDGDPWLPQWGIAFWIGSLGMAALCARRSRAGMALAAMLVAQAAFWMFATHMKARFLLPCAVPLAVGTAAALAPVLSQWRGRLTTAVIAVALFAHAMLPLAVARMDARTQGALALCASLGSEAARIGPGSPAAAEESASLGEAMPLPWIANWRLPAGAVLGCEGEADVFWMNSVPVTGTVWDGGPLARALRRFPADPVAAARSLRTDEGLTHLAIGESMLSRWKDAGWLDPALAPERVRAVAALLRPVARTASGGTVYEVPAPSGPGG
jgi:4-amino-4-deoxy-L-arabinose transferase-like glycosyltransferase